MSDSPDPKFAPVVDAFAKEKNISTGVMMSSFGLKVNKKIFAMHWRGQLVVKLPKPRVDEIVVTAIVNFWLNYGIAWFVFRAAAAVPLWGASSIAVDTVATAFVLPLLTSLIATPLVRLQVYRGKLPPLAPEDVRPSAWLRLPFAARGALLGV